MSKPLPHWPQFDDETVNAVEKVLRSGRVNDWTGPKGMQFEDRFAAWQRSRFAVSVGDGQG